MKYSSASRENDLNEVVQFTKAVIFLGTPHRGSFDIVALGEKARKSANALLMDTSSATLDSLGLKNSDLERCQESFSRTWANYGFRVKTFQEALPMSGLNIGPLNMKVCFKGLREHRHE